MKKILLLAFLVISFSYNLKAQEFRAGLIGGIVASQVDGDRIGGFYKAGFSGGLFVYRDLNKVSRIALYNERK
jgi:hypothetical protein